MASRRGGNGSPRQICGRTRPGFRLLSTLAGITRSSVPVLCLLLLSSWAHALDVEEIRFWSLGEITRVVIQFDGDFRYKWARLDNPPRVFFDLPEAGLGKVSPNDRGRMRTIEVNDPALKQIRYAENTPGSSRVVLDLAGDFKFTASQLANPPRLIIEIRGKTAGDGQVEVSRTGAVNSGTERPTPPSSAAESSASRVAAENPPPVPARKSGNSPVKVPATNTNATQVGAPAAGTQSQKSPSSAVAATLPNPEPSREKESAVAVEAPAPVVTTARAAPQPSRAETADSNAGAAPLATPAARTATGQQSLIRALGLKIGKVVIDPGHGGKDEGTRSPDGLLEKDLVLDVAKRLRTLIEEKLGSEVILTREEDVFIQLEERPIIANQHRADLYVSLHANSSPFRLASGSETFYLDFTTSRESMDIAARENASSTKSVADLQDIIKRIALKDKRDESRDFAAKIQSSLFKSQRNAGTAKKNRGVKSAPFVVLVGAEMPAILVEMGFLSNKKEEEKLTTGEYRQSLAQAIFEGLESYMRSLSHFEGRERAAKE